MGLTRKDPTRRGFGKYALIRLDKLDDEDLADMLDRFPGDLRSALLAKLMADPSLIEFGFKGEPDEFFAIKLRDRNSRGALGAYAMEAKSNGMDELALYVEALAKRSAQRNPFCKLPD